MIQPWMSAAALDACPDAKAKGAGAPFSDGEYFNGMINPLLPFQPAAVLWHQGEENAQNPVEYNCFFRAMINDWRQKFAATGGGSPHLPFSFVQLQPCGVPPAQRYAQAAALALPNVGMATAVDLLDPGNTSAQACAGFEQRPGCLNPNGMCHTRWKHEIAERLVAVTAPMLFNLSAYDGGEAAAAVDIGIGIPPASPRIGRFVAMKDKDYRTYVVSLSVQAAADVSIEIGGSKECTLCCETPSFAVEYTTTAPGEHWLPLGTVPDKHGTPLVYDTATKQLQLTMVVEPPWKPSGLRHSWRDAPQCLLFGAPSGMPMPPFNISWTPP